MHANWCDHEWKAKRECNGNAGIKKRNDHDSLPSSQRPPPPPVTRWQQQPVRMEAGSCCLPPPATQLEVAASPPAAVEECQGSASPGYGSLCFTSHPSLSLFLPQLLRLLFCQRAAQHVCRPLFSLSPDLFATIRHRCAPAAVAG